MFELQVPWWELVARAATVYGVLLVLVRLSGKRTVGQFTPFDLLVVVLLSEGVSNALLGGDESLLGGLIVAATLLGLNAIVSRLTARSDKIRRIAEGDAVVVGRDGEILHDRLKAEHVSKEDVLQALRESDCDIGDMKLALLEADGKISILRQAQGMAAYLKGEQTKPAAD
jgi:uncharacterized membrane protein YcaP (DUF421 family)